MNKAKEEYEKWCYAAKDHDSEMPLFSALLYRVCRNEVVLFYDAEKMMQAAFVAGFESAHK